LPRLTVNRLDERDPWANQIQSNRIGELGICGAGAAIIKAIYDATRIRVRDLPASLDKVLPGLDQLE
jgi:xanthine dehydrogenase YagR molybdenum-binding subunit